MHTQQVKSRHSQHTNTHKPNSVPCVSIQLTLSQTQKREGHSHQHIDVHTRFILESHFTRHTITSSIHEKRVLVEPEASGDTLFVRIPRQLATQVPKARKPWGIEKQIRHPPRRLCYSLRGVPGGASSRGWSTRPAAHAWRASMAVSLSRARTAYRLDHSRFSYSSSTSA